MSALKTAETILTEVLGSPPLRVAVGATIPIGKVFACHLGAGTIFFSRSTLDADYRAPNQHFRLSSFRTGQTARARLFERLGRQT